MNKIIYTCITGKYDQLKDPKVVTPGWEYVALVDDPNLYKSDIWQIRKVKMFESLSAAMNNRYYKIHPPFRGLHGTLLIYIDGSVQIQDDLNDFMLYANHSFITALKHPSRQCIYQECKRVVQVNKANKVDVENWQAVLRSENYPRMIGLNECRILIRSYNALMNRLMNQWWDCVQETERDQLSYNYVLWDNDVFGRSLENQLFSKYFKIFHHGSINSNIRKVSNVGTLRKGKLEPVRIRNISVR